MSGSTRTGIPVLCCAILLGIPALAVLSGAFHLMPGTPLQSSDGGILQPGPVSEQYIPPPGVMPVVILQGTPYEMGYQYGLQAPGYIALVRDAAWASALSRNSSDEIVESCSVSREYIARELTGFRFLDFFQGISDAMNDQGIPFTPLDPIVMTYYGGRLEPGPPEHCTAFAAFGNCSGNELIVGVNFDFFQVPSNSYEVLLALYPDDGYSCLIPSGAGRTGSNVVVNEKGLVYVLTAGPSGGPGDSGAGINGFLELPYVGMTDATVPEAEYTLLSLTAAVPLNNLLADPSGTAEVIETTRARYAIRHPEPDGSGDFIIATNHYLEPAMKPSQPVWDPLHYYPSSHYRSITAEKMLLDHYGSVNYTVSRQVLSSLDWWDGQEWHRDDPWSTNTINRFSPDFSTLYSLIAIPDERVVSICTGNPGVPVWGPRAPGQTGTFINFTVESTPEDFVSRLRTEANRELWETVQCMGSGADGETVGEWASIENLYWEGVWWHDRGVLEKTTTARAVALGRAATDFSSVIARAEQIQAAAGRED